MNTKLIALIAALIIGIAAYVYVAAPEDGNMPAADDTHSESNEMSGDHAADMAMDEHKRLMDDGETFMAMNNEISPAVLYARPGQELTFASHEPFPVQLKTTDGMYSTQLAQPGDKHSIFIAPSTPGRYEFVSSHDANVRAVVIVEE